MSDSGKVEVDHEVAEEIKKNGHALVHDKSTDAFVYAKVQTIYDRMWNRVYQGAVIMLTAFIFGGAGWLYAIDKQVQANTAILKLGPRFTLQDGELLRDQLNGVKRDVALIEQEVKAIEVPPVWFKEMVYRMSKQVEENNKAIMRIESKL